MKSIARVEKDDAVKNQPSAIDAFAKRAILSLLKKVKHGRLTIEDGGEVYVFGQEQTETELVAHINVHHPSAYRRVLFGGTIGSGEAYMQHWWSSPDTTQVTRFFVANKDATNNLDSPWSAVKNFFRHMVDRFNINTKSGSRANISAHYDLNNDFFSLFLDPSMMYSSAIYPSEQATLEEAATFKLQHVCERLQLTPDDHLLEIGTGWGGMAIHAAQHFGCKVTTTTISDEQYAYAKQRVEQLGLQNQITLLKKDYRDLTGQYDKLVSIEMIEAVGHQYYKTFFSTCNRLLKPTGLMLLQSITTLDQRYELEKNESDFIRHFIFPGGCLPCNKVISQCIAKYTDMHTVGLEDITADYVKTLAQWKRRFFANIDAVKELGFDDVFIRMWDFYLSFCEGGFAERVIATSQFLFAKPKCRRLPKIV